MEMISQEEVAKYNLPILNGGLIGAERLAVRTQSYYEDLDKSGGLGHLPYKQVFDEFQFQPGELTVYAGETKSKKSFLTGFFFLHLALQGYRCALASFEMNPEVTFERMCRAYTGKDHRTNGNDKMDLGERIQGKLWLYDHLGTVHVSDVYKFIAYCAMEYKIKHIMIDSLMMVEFNDGSNLYNDQKNFVTELKQLARSYDVHIHLVCHFKKPDNINRRASVYDISGSAGIPNIADNLFLISKENNPDYPKITTGLILDRCRSHMEWHDSMGLSFLNNFQFPYWRNAYSMDKQDIDKGAFF